MSKLQNINWGREELRSIEGTLPSELSEFLGSSAIDKAPAYEVRTYRELMKYVAKLAYLNKDYLLFFRGQNNDYKNRAGASTFYPSIYRGDYLPSQEVIYRFDILNQASKSLVDAFAQEKIDGHHEIKRKKHIQWSILQHYGVCDTPLLDFTHSVRVACSFAQMNNSGDGCFVYVFALPYITNRISINSEHDLVNVRLLSICPPDALRPYYQEGYLAGTEDLTTEYDSKTELDFKNRLIAKFKISMSSSFWGDGFSSIPKNALYPKGDRIEKLCKDVHVVLERDLRPGEIGDFLKLWTQLEELLIGRAKKPEARMLSTREAILILAKEKQLEKSTIYELDTLRQFRNQLVHKPKTIEPLEIQRYLHSLSDILSRIQ